MARLKSYLHQSWMPTLIDAAAALDLIATLERIEPQEFRRFVIGIRVMHRRAIAIGTGYAGVRRAID